MEHEKLRRNICFEAARLLHARREADFAKARWRAARAITGSYLDSDCLPTDREIRAALQQLVVHDVPAAPSTLYLNEPLEPTDHLPVDRFERFHAILEPLDRVCLNRDMHPEGDLLYHSLQVFELAKEARPWDEEFLLAALLHDVGRGIDPYDGLSATLDVICELVSERTVWFIENLPTQHRVHEGTIGIRARRRLSQHEDGEELRLLAHCDSDGRVPGRQVSDLADAIEYIRELNAE